VALALELLTGSGVLAAEDRGPADENTTATSLPEITAIAPTWGPSGSVFSLTLEGRNLAGASEVRFYPSTGIVVEDPPVVNSEGTVVNVKVTILVHAPLGPRLIAVRTPAGQSSLTPTEANTFKVSFAHLH
jgi:hypothetical protein